MAMYMDKSNLVELFKQPCEKIQTTGTQEGIILKFQSFYLKIYDDHDESYIVQGYRYNASVPMFVDKVSAKEFRRYAASF